MSLSSETRPATETPRPPPSTSLEEIFRRWGLDAALRRYYDRGLGIEHLYPWQAKCLAEHGVAEGTRNLLYFAPTSGGKTMVAELLLLLRVMGLPASPEPERNRRQGGLGMGQQKGEPGARKVVFVLPFISMVTEKAKHLQRVVAPYNRGRPRRQRIKVKALYGSKGGGHGGIRGTQIAVCTIEKANALINRMAVANELHELSCLVLDELHMIGEGGRGQTLELLLSKLVRANRAAYDDGSEEVAGGSTGVPAARTVSGDRSSESRPQPLPPPPQGNAADTSEEDVKNLRGKATGRMGRRTQIIGMSATLSNGAELAAWLGAILHVSDYRPVPLDERVMLGMHVYDKSGTVVRSFSEPAHPETDPDHVVTLCRESCSAHDQVIIFCSTKQFCHNCAIKVAKNLGVTASKAVAAERSALMVKLAKETCIGVDPILQETIPQGVAFHHAGLADTERAAIESAFRAGTLGVLAATSTLGAGVNLPAGRVILRNLNGAGGGLNATSYRQMAGRAGRKGAGRARGEAFLIASNKGQATKATALMNAGLAAVKSALKPSADGGAGLTKLVLEGVCGGLVRRESDLPEYLACSLLFHQQHDGVARESLLDYAFAALQVLVDEACVELVPQIRPTKAAPAPAPALVPVRPASGARQPGAKLPLISPYIRSGLRKIPQSASVAVPAGRASKVSAGNCVNVVGMDDGRFKPTKLGMAIFRSSLGPAEGLMVYRDLSEAKHGINLRNTLRLAYLLTPLCPPSGLKPNWERLCAMYSRAKATSAATQNPDRRSASLVDDFHRIGITEGHLHVWTSRGPSGATKQGPILSPDYVREVASVRRGNSAPVSRGRGDRVKASAAQKAVRLVAAMILKDVSDGYNLGQVAKSYGISKGDLQTLRQSTATFSSMVASFLKELGWTMFLMIVKGYVPRLSLGVSNNLLPLMQVPGMSRTEAGALYRGGIVNAKSLLAASNEKVAMALRMNVPFRMRTESGASESVRFERRAQILKIAAGDMDAKREKDNKAQAIKLLKAVQGRLAKGDACNGLGGALADLGGESDVLVSVAPSKSRKRRRSDDEERGTDARAKAKGRGGCSDSLGPTGLSDEELEGDDSSDASGSGCDTDGSDLEGSDDMMDEVTEAMLFAERVADEAEEDSAGSEDESGFGRRAGEIGEGSDPGVGSGCKLREDGRSSVAKSGRSLGDDTEAFSSRGEGSSPREKLRQEAAAKRRKTCNRAIDRGSSRGTRDPAAGGGQPQTREAGTAQASKATVILAKAKATVEAEVEARTTFGDTHRRDRPLADSTEALAREPSGPVVPHAGSIGGAGSSKESLPSAEAAAARVSSNGSAVRGNIKCDENYAIDNARTPEPHRATQRTPKMAIRPPPEMGSSSPSFLYEASSPIPREGKTRLGNCNGASPCPALDACRPCPGRVQGGLPSVRDVFAGGGGAAAVAKFSTSWRRSKCFSFAIGGRRGLPRVGPGAGAAAGGWSSGRTGLGCSYPRAWEALMPSRLPLVPYTVPSAGESFVPLARHENENATRVVSGIAVSFDGVASHYLSLPPQLPRRPIKWQRLYDDSGVRGRSAPGSLWSSTLRVDHCKDSSGGRAAFPAKAIEAVAQFVGFPWLCSDCSGHARRRKCARHSHSSSRDGASIDGTRRREPWNQTLMVSRRWNALGVEVLNRLATEEPSGRWRLVRDMMEDPDSIKVCLDMKGALVCLRSLGIEVRGSLEDPEVARWLVEPAVDELTPLQPREVNRNKRKTAPAPPPRAPPESLILDRQPKGFVDLWGMQAAETLSLMGKRERDLKDLNLALAFHLIEMPAVRAAAMMEYCGLALKTSVVSDMRRDLDLKLRDLENVADHLAGDREAAGDKTSLASPKRVHDILYTAMGVKPPPSWRSSGGGDGRHVAPPRGGTSKRVSLGPTDTGSLQELLEVAGTEAPAEDARGFIRAVIQHRALAPAARSLDGLMAARRWHPHFGGVRVNPSVDMFTTTGRMIASNPPLQNLEHKIRFKRSWRLSLAEEMEAEVPDLQAIPRVWAGQDGEDTARVGEESRHGAMGSMQDASIRDALRVIVANTGESGGVSFGAIVAIVENRCLDDPVYRQQPASLPWLLASPLPPPSSADVGVQPAREVAKGGGVGEACAALGGESMASFWRNRGHPYTPWEASTTRQVLIRLGFQRGGDGGVGASAKAYSYPADKVFRMRASFLSEAKSEALKASAGCVPKHPWFGEEAVLRPRGALVPSQGYVFVSADYSQIEMRLMAHLSGDPDLLGVFADGGDVFRAIAAALQGGGKMAAHITDDERSQTKIVVYGVLYGQSAETLAPQLGVSRPRAWKIRETVLKTYPRLRDFLRRVKDDCKKRGFVETLLGRRRYLPHINSADAKERARAERQAANTVCQGSAADLLKLAATNVASRLERCEWMWMSRMAAKESLRNASRDTIDGGYSPPSRFSEDGGRSEFAKNPACRLVLSIHDELLYEVLEPHADEVARVVRACMEGACSLLVPLVAQPRIGKTWANMSDVEAK